MICMDIDSPENVKTPVRVNARRYGGVTRFMDLGALSFLLIPALLVSK